MSTHLLDEEQYIEDGYIDTSYFGGLIDGQIQVTGYFEDDYIDQSYYSLAGMQFSLTASLTPAVVDGSATLSSAFGVSASVENVLYASANIDCSATLSADIGVTRSFSINASSTASLSTQETYLVSLPAANLPIALSSSFSISVDAKRTRSDDANITTSATLSVDIIRIQDASSSLQTESTISSTASRTRGIELNVSSSATISSTPYRIIQAGADIDSVMASTLTVTVFKNHDAAMDSAFTQSADINFTSDTSGLLEYFADLDAQAARTRGIDAGLNSSFFTSDSSGSLSNDIDASVTVDAASILTASSSLSISVVTVELAEADITAEFNLDVHYIAWRSKWYDHDYRPLNIDTSDFADYDSSIKKHGTHSLRLKRAGSGFAATEEIKNYLSLYLEIAADEEFVAETWVYYNTAASSWTTSAGSPILFNVGQQGTAFGIHDLEEIVASSNNDSPNGTLLFAVGLTDIYVPALNKRMAYPQAKFIVEPTSGLGYSVETLTSSSYIEENAWNHIALSRNSSGSMRLHVNNNITATANQSGRSLTVSSQRIGFKNNFYSTNLQDVEWVWFDSFTFRIGDSTLSTYNGYPRGTEDTIVLYSFDNTGNDDLGLDLFGSATLSSSTSFSATAQKLISTNANLQSVIRIFPTVSKIVDVDANLDATGSQLAVIGKLGSFFVNADVAANISTDAARFRTVDADLSNVVSATIDAGKTTDTSANITGAFTPTVTANVTRNDEVDLATTTAITATPTRVRSGESNIDTAVSITANGFSIIDINADIASTFTQADTDYIRYRDADIDLDATGSQLVAIAKTAGFFVNADISANLSATGVVKTGTVIDVLLSTDLSADVDNLKGFDSNLNSVFEATATGVLVTGADAAITSAFITSTDAARTRGIETDFDSIATQLSVIGKIMPYTAGLDSAFAMTATPVKTTDVDADIEFAATITPLITRAKPLAADLTSTTALTGTLNKTTTFSSNITGTATLTATGAIKVFNLEQYYYTIPAETRSHTIAGETRSHSIARETRTYTLEGT